MSTLSNIDIQTEIVKENILIHPFCQKNLKASSYDLTVSRVAYKISDKSESPSKISYQSAYDQDKGKVIIPAKSVVIVWTNESIYVSKSISGTYHSRVRLVAKGLGHIGTTLDPGYLGSSAITVHNHSDYDLELDPEKDTFATLMFQYVKTESTKEHGNPPGKPDLPIVFTDEEERWLKEDFRQTKDSLKKTLEKLPPESDYQEIVKKSIKNKNKYSFLYPYIIYGVLIVIVLQPFFPVPFSDKIVTGFVGAFAAQLVNDVKRKNEN
ncbi:dCTP deaminase domain-containing protein [Crocosphaera sp. XPORK-15E]|uniref:dCTP deaminase domain-containing protein n=1 Tax=Crocosphaera sp. XPORK-15E TaxID=3110247 RepID=UPI002B1F14CA|nr:deoxycytidine triphosphate deaminase [Crocosphaera sp. XPORK-15E]MEA5535476.1 deoxycytidine triphosphate deaminase [Crocosphaera sp. XPORK-15E]